ncbi:MAG: hypothetical protein ABR537_05765 [Gemmatimonadales bacterium]
MCGLVQHDALHEVDRFIEDRDRTARRGADDDGEGEEDRLFFAA